jgi:hypothetical protein
MDGVLRDLGNIPRGRPNSRENSGGHSGRGHCPEYLARYFQLVLGALARPFDESELAEDAMHWPDGRMAGWPDGRTPGADVRERL